VTIRAGLGNTALQHFRNLLDVLVELMDEHEMQLRRCYEDADRVYNQCLERLITIKAEKTTAFSEKNRLQGELKEMKRKIKEGIIDPNELNLFRRNEQEMEEEITEVKLNIENLVSESRQLETDKPHPREMQKYYKERVDEARKEGIGDIEGLGTINNEYRYIWGRYRNDT
jgi:ATP-dependent protease HslVU (ClpYQ) ATPase subunit